MPDLSEFGTEKYPIRCSEIPKVMQCPLRAMMMFNKAAEDHSGQAADTGSAVHAAIEFWYQHRLSVRDAIQAMQLELPRFPIADLHDAEQQFISYAADPRNQGAKIIACEKEVTVDIPPAEHDTTRAPIRLIGHLDQIREEDGVWKLWDVKTSKRNGLTILREHIMQQCAYMYAATKNLGRTIHPGGVIMTRRYLVKGVDPRTSPPGVFFHYALTYEQMMLAFDGFRDIVANIRNGNVWANPGDYCEWCPLGGHDNCIPMFERVLTCGI